MNEPEARDILFYLVVPFVVSLLITICLLFWFN